MSTYEKIVAAIAAAVVLLMIAFSYREIREAPGPLEANRGSRFDKSLGAEFKIGIFTREVSHTSSKEDEPNCQALHPEITAALHDIKERLEHQKAYFGIEDTFEVNNATLDLFCEKEAQIVLADGNGNSLVLQKVPFTRTLPPRGSSDDIGTVVRINATLIKSGIATPTTPTAFGEILIPDRFLDDPRQ